MPPAKRLLFWRFAQDDYDGGSFLAPAAAGLQSGRKRARTDDGGSSGLPDEGALGDTTSDSEGDESDTLNEPTVFHIVDGDGDSETVSSEEDAELEEDVFVESREPQDDGLRRSDRIRESRNSGARERRDEEGGRVLSDDSDSDAEEGGPSEWQNPGGMAPPPPDPGPGGDDGGHGGSDPILRCYFSWELKAWHIPASEFPAFVDARARGIGPTIPRQRRGPKPKGLSDTERALLRYYFNSGLTRSQWRGLRELVTVTFGSACRDLDSLIKAWAKELFPSNTPYICIEVIPSDGIMIKPVPIFLLDPLECVRRLARRVSIDEFSGGEVDLRRFRTSPWFIRALADHRGETADGRAILPFPCSLFSDGVIAAVRGRTCKSLHAIYLSSPLLSDTAHDERGSRRGRMQERHSIAPLCFVPDLRSLAQSEIERSATDGVFSAAFQALPNPQQRAALLEAEDHVVQWSHRLIFEALQAGFEAGIPAKLGNSAVVLKPMIAFGATDMVETAILLGMRRPGKKRCPRCLPADITSLEDTFELWDAAEVVNLMKEDSDDARARLRALGFRDAKHVYTDHAGEVRPISPWWDQRFRPLLGRTNSGTWTSEALPCDVMHCLGGGILQRVYRSLKSFLLSQADILHISMTKLKDLFDRALRRAPVIWSEECVRKFLGSTGAAGMAERGSSLFDVDIYDHQVIRHLLVSAMPLVVSSILPRDTGVLAVKHARLKAMRILARTHYLCRWTHELPVYAQRITPEHLPRFQDDVVAFGDAFSAISPEDDLEWPKYHSLVHLVESVGDLGLPIVFSCAPFERAHRSLAKAPFESTSRVGRLLLSLEVLSRSSCVYFADDLKRTGAEVGAGAAEGGNEAEGLSGAALAEEGAADGANEATLAEEGAADGGNAPEETGAGVQHGYVVGEGLSFDEAMRKGVFSSLPFSDAASIRHHLADQIRKAAEESPSLHAWSEEESDNPDRAWASLRFYVNYHLLTETGYTNLRVRQRRAPATDSSPNIPLMREPGTTPLSLVLRGIGDSSHTLPIYSLEVPFLDSEHPYGIPPCPTVGTGDIFWVAHTHVFFKIAGSCTTFMFASLAESGGDEHGCSPPLHPDLAFASVRSVFFRDSLHYSYAVCMASQIVTRAPLVKASLFGACLLDDDHLEEYLWLQSDAPCRLLFGT